MAISLGITLSHDHTILLSPPSPPLQYPMLCFTPLTHIYIQTRILKHTHTHTPAHPKVGYPVRFGDYKVQNMTGTLYAYMHITAYSITAYSITAYSITVLYNRILYTV
jgi:hypothetical protein